MRRPWLGSLVASLAVAATGCKERTVEPPSPDAAPLVWNAPSPMPVSWFPVDARWRAQARAPALRLGPIQGDGVQFLSSFHRTVALFGAPQNSDRCARAGRARRSRHRGDDRDPPGVDRAPPDGVRRSMPAGGSCGSATPAATGSKPHAQLPSMMRPRRAPAPRPPPRSSPAGRSRARRGRPQPEGDPGQQGQQREEVRHGPLPLGRRMCALKPKRRLAVAWAQ